jgi:hypothetical protein
MHSSLRASALRLLLVLCLALMGSSPSSALSGSRMGCRVTDDCKDEDWFGFLLLHELWSLLSLIALPIGPQVHHGLV